MGGINKMDSSVDGETYSEKRFIEIATEVKRILLQEGWKKEQIEKEIPILPLAGFHGENLLKKSEKMPWWKGVTVFDPTTKKEIQVNCLLDALNDMVNKSDTEFKACETFVVQAMVLDHPGQLRVGYTPTCYVRTSHVACRLMEIRFKAGKKSTGGQKVESPEFIEKG